MTGPESTYRALNLLTDTTRGHFSSSMLLEDSRPNLDKGQNKVHGVINLFQPNLCAGRSIQGFYPSAL